MDGVLARLIRRAMRRGLAGEPAWLAVGVAIWLVRRARNRGPDVVWSGRLSPGERVVVAVHGSDGAPATE